MGKSNETNEVCETEEVEMLSADEIRAIESNDANNIIFAIELFYENED